jgi:hypothetical protein
MLRHSELSKKIIAAVLVVYKERGYDFDRGEEIRNDYKRVP